MNRRNLLAAAMAAGGSWASLASAQEAPGHAITLMHGFAPGGPADAIARLVALPMGKALGQVVVVEPRPGAGGNIAAAALSRAVPDGSVIGLVTGGHAVTAAFGRNQNYDPLDGFEAVSQVARYAFVLAVRADHPALDLKAALRMAASAPRGWQFGSAGSGTTQHLAGELLNAMSGLQMMHVPYRGDAASITGVLGGEIPLAITAANVAIPLVQGGQIRLLATTGPVRSARLPEVPTVAEVALPGYDASSWAGLLAPRGTQPAVVARLNAAAAAALHDKAVQTRLADLLDGEAVPGTPAALRALMAQEITRWRELIQARRIVLE
ncbi:tripartite tricarboxylate transporter substrate-binding protein [Roseomonas sp. GC11]|uniref:tripartite tricarboxylate transporter substrate-binding protein n=1 Tax=Roseomonas sp. GC11 TaxID=2950546 RepID=UPI00210E415F|nr:tripartite tricarboxylate transporter substrate-binding protein [Roseomonas sp. GC11]MCQ4159035.1 tripartite tricarboxylate transporter substrate-binding protein [Roseomonas sp. GC11]